MFISEINIKMMETLELSSQFRLMFRLFAPELPTAAFFPTSPPLDRHPNREIMFVLEGAGPVFFNNRIYLAEKRSLFFFDAYEPHDFGYRPAMETRLVFWLCYSLDGTISGALHVVEPSGKYDMPHTFALGNSEPALLLSHVWDEVNNESLPSRLGRLRLMNCFAVVMQEFLVQEMLDNYHDLSKIGVAQSHKIAIICRHLQMTKGKGDSIRSLAKMAGYSEFHFMKLFRRFQGCGVKEYIHEIRLQVATELEHANFSQKEIAEYLGFSSASSFSHWRLYQRRKVMKLRDGINREISE